MRVIGKRVVWTLIGIALFLDWACPGYGASARAFTPLLFCAGILLGIPGDKVAVSLGCFAVAFALQQFSPLIESYWDKPDLRYSLASASYSLAIAFSYGVLVYLAVRHGLLPHLRGLRSKSPCPD